MNAGQLIILARDVIDLLIDQEILHTDGTFDTSKLDTIAEDVAFAVKIENLLALHGLDVPERVTAIINILPLIAQAIG